MEYAISLADVVSRLEGGNVSGRPNPFAKAVRIVVNEPISAAPYWETYRSNRRKAVAGLTEELLQSFRRTAEQ